MNKIAPDKFACKFETSQSNGCGESSTLPPPHTADAFKSKREFNNKFPSKYYICTKCGKLTADKYFCSNCKNQSNNFIYQGYTYTLLDSGLTETIFIPIELIKESEEQNDNDKN